MKAIAFSEKLKRRSELTVDVFGVPDWKTKKLLWSTKMASEKVLMEQEASSQGLERSQRGQRDQRSLGDAVG